MNYIEKCAKTINFPQLSGECAGEIKAETINVRLLRKTPIRRKFRANSRALWVSVL